MRNWILRWKDASKSWLFEKLNRFLSSLVVVGIQFYRTHLKFFIVGECRYTPSCSQYALEAVDAFPVWKAAPLICSRLCRCHPFSQGGWDPVQREESNVL